MKLSSVFHLALKSAFFDLFAQNFSAVALLCPQNFKQTGQKIHLFQPQTKTLDNFHILVIHKNNI